MTCVTGTRRGISPDVPGDLPRLGNVLTINGQPKAAEATIPTGGRARVRLVNASAARILNIRFAGPQATIVAIDGQPSSTAFQPKGAAVIMTPGGRIDLMVDLPGDAGQEFSVLAQLGPDAAIPLLSLKSAGDRRPALTPIAALPANETPDKIDLARAQRAEIAIEGGTQPKGPAIPWTLNKRTGQITMHNEALAAGAIVGFTLTNSEIAATDVIGVSIASGATADSYALQVDAVAAGSCRIHLHNKSAGSLSEAVVINFVVINGASA